MEAQLSHNNQSDIQIPYKRLTIWQHLSISSFWCGLNCVWGAMLAIIMARQIEHIVGDIRKAPMLGLARMCGAVIATILPLFIGGMSDRCMSPLGRRRPYIIVGFLAFVPAFLLMYYSAELLSYWLYFVGFCVLQVGMNIAASAYYGIIPDIVPEDQRGIASGYMGFMSNIGTMLGIGISGLTIDRYPALTYILIGSIFLLTAILTVWNVKEVPLTIRRPKLPWLEYFKSLWISPRKYPDFAWVWFTRFLVMVGFYFVQPFMLYYLENVIHVHNAAEKVAIVGGLILITAALTGLWAGSISEKIGRKRVVYIANTLVAVTCVALIFCRTLEQVYFVVLIFGAGFGAYVSVDWALGTDVLPTKIDAGKEMAVWHIAMTLPQTGEGIAGVMLASFGVKVINGVKVYTSEGYAAILTISAICFALGAYGLRFVKKVR